MAGHRSNAELREHDRVPLFLPAKLLVKSDYSVRDCTVADLSVGGAGLHYTRIPPQAGLPVRLTIQGFGEFEAVTTRQAGTQVGVRFLPGEAERQNMLQKLTVYVVEGIAGLSNNQSQSAAPLLQLPFTRPCGERHQCDVSNISLRGVTLKTAARPPVGEIITLGRMSGRVALHSPEGIGVLFLNFVEETAPG